jgi:hypothetical protein
VKRLVHLFVVLGFALLAPAQTCSVCESQDSQALQEVVSSSSPDNVPTLKVTVPVSHLHRVARLLEHRRMAESPYSVVTAKPLHTKFWDRQNVVAFAALGGARALDLHSTWRFRARGINEGQLSNGLVDNKPLFATFSAGMVGSSILTSYILHRTQHHKLERLSNYLNLTAVASTVAWNYKAVPSR